LVAAAEAGLPIVTPGWEDSTTGNMYAAALIRGDLHEASTVKSGVEAMVGLAAWYTQASREGPVGMFQIGGGIAGDFPICVVPMLNQDVGEWVPTWSYFAQVSDSTTSYGSYSGAVPNEKITWGKLTPEAPSFVIESDATIVAPLVFALLAGA
jgi:deoxyhypusine synthase